MNGFVFHRGGMEGKGCVYASVRISMLDLVRIEVQCHHGNDESVSILGSAAVLGM